MINEEILKAKSRIKIGIDMMGGKNAPHAQLDALARFMYIADDVDIIAYGGESIKNNISSRLSRFCDRFEFISTTDAVQDDDSALFALKNRKDSSMYIMIEDIANKKIDGCISSGNTGALMLISKMILGTSQGIKRPAIMGILPTKEDMVVILDLGANTDCTEHILLQFAHMGSCFSNIIFKKENPRLMILNVGEENIKGRQVERNAAKLLSDSGLNFKGYIEPNEIFDSKADVIVTDGFTGNVLLKTSEGTAQIFLRMLKNIAGGNFLNKILMLCLKKALKAHLNKFNPDLYNGALLAGINGIVVKSHGGATGNGFYSALNNTRELILNKINERIAEHIEQGSIINSNISSSTGIDGVIDKIKEFFIDKK